MAAPCNIMQTINGITFVEMIQQTPLHWAHISVNRCIYQRKFIRLFIFNVNNINWNLLENIGLFFCYRYISITEMKTNFASPQHFYTVSFDERCGTHVGDVPLNAECLLFTKSSICRSLGVVSLKCLSGEYHVYLVISSIRINFNLFKRKPLQFIDPLGLNPYMW